MKTIIGSLCISLLLFIQILFPQQTRSVIKEAPAEIAPLTAPFIMPNINRPVFPSGVFNIKDFGAVEGGTVKNTEAIRRTIRAASEKGGGTVLIPAGKWLTGPIHLENNINLRLELNAELLFSQQFEDYLPAVFSRHEDVECYKYSAFIYAEGKTNIAITGEGVLNGQGKPWWDWKTKKKDSETRLREMGDNNVPVKERIFDGRNGLVLRPAFFQPMNCKNILVEGVTFLYGAFWTITPTYCENVIVRKVKIVTEGDYGHTPNGDGVDPSSCKNVLIEYCEFDTGDDCIAIKAGRDRDGLRVGIPTENLIVRHCVGLRGHGGIVIGSETSGGVRNVYGFDCQFNGTDRIVRIKTSRGRGGTIENMWFRDLSADTIEAEALHINMLYTGKRLPAEPITNATPKIRNIHFSSISCSAGKSFAIELLGLPEMHIENITFDSIFVSSAKGISCNDVKNISLKNIHVLPKIGPLVQVLDGEQVSIDGIDVPEGTKTVLAVDGAGSRNITMKNFNPSKALNVVQQGPDVAPGEIILFPAE
jgi:hypothetical protein